MRNEEVLFDNGVHKCVCFRLDDEEFEEGFLAVNQYLIIDHDDAILIDPGNRGIFDELYEAISQHINPSNLRYIFLSHQDPDVADGIGDWSVVSGAQILISHIWVRFLSHYGLMQMHKIVQIPDEGLKFGLADATLECIPAHFLHSPGNFSLYDPVSKILFSGDIGATIMYPQQTDQSDVGFDQLIPKLEGFHKRYMAGNRFCKAWVERVRDKPISMIAPQHGIIFQQKQSEAFFSWFSELECGGDIMFSK